MTLNVLNGCRFDTSSMLVLAGIFNLAVLILVDVAFGQTAIIATSICLNLLLSVKRATFTTSEVLFMMIVAFVITRQFLIIFSDLEIYIETVIPVLAWLYIASFVLYLKKININMILVGVRVYVYLHALGGFLDLQVNIYPLHGHENEIGRFRGLANEPNLIAIPLALILLSGISGSLKTRLFYWEKLLLAAMIFFSMSKFAFLLIIVSISWLWFRTILKGSILYVVLILLSVVTIYHLPYSYYYRFPLYSGLIQFINWDYFASMRVLDYLLFLKGSDQFLGGSLTTRAITFYTSIIVLLENPQFIIFGTGGGNSYLSLIESLRANDLFNHELQLHLVSYPPFITDKTFILKNTLEFGAIMYILLVYAMYRSKVRRIGNSFLLYFLRVSLLFCTCQLIFFPVIIMLIDKVESNE